MNITSDFDWSTAAVAMMRELWAEGLTASVIAVRLGRGVTRNAVLGKVHRLKLTASPVKPRTIARPRKPRQPQPGQIRFRQKPKVTVTPLVKLQMMKARPEGHLEPAASGHVSIVQLSAKTCRWPIGDPAHPAFCYCGGLPKDGTPYCEFHADKAYNKRHGLTSKIGARA